MKGAEARQRRAEQMAERLMLTMEGEKELPPVLEVAFRGTSCGAQGMGGDDGGAAAIESDGGVLLPEPEARQKRVQKVVEDCLKVANDETGSSFGFC